jgi:hypothetical protein
VVGARVVVLACGAMLVVLVREETVRVRVTIDVLVTWGGTMVVELDGVELFLRIVSMRSGKGAVGRYTLEHLQQQQLKLRGEGWRASFW